MGLNTNPINGTGRNTAPPVAGLALTDKEKRKAFPKNMELEVPNQKDKNEGMTLAGIGNAAEGNAVFEMLKNFLTNEENKSASSGQAQEIIIF